jgi:glycosyltransferase involved in cell wall biosynthesis
MISVIMAAYNAEKYLREAVDSVIAQTYPHWELIVVDDGSTDNTLKILQDYAAKDSRIRVLQADHGGASHARNVAIQAAQYPWIAVLDADDVCLPNRLQRQIEMAESDPEVVVWGTDGYHINSQGEVLSSFRVGPTTKEKCHEMREAGKIVQCIHPTAMLRRDRVLEIGGYVQAVAPAEDVDIFDRLMQFGPLVTIPEPLVKYRIHGTSLSMTKHTIADYMVRYVEARMAHRKATGQELTLEQFATMDKARPWLQRLFHNIYVTSKFYYRRGGMAYGEGRYLQAAYWLGRSFLLRPWYPVRRAWRQVFSPRARRNMQSYKETQQTAET